MSWTNKAERLARLHKLNVYEVMHEAQRAIDSAYDAGIIHGARIFFILTDASAVAVFKVNWQPRVAPSIDVA